MIFNIYNDGGNIVQGIVIPDSFSAQVAVRAYSGGVELGVFIADELNPDVRDIGQHETGLVNFSITEEKLPGIGAIEDLEIRDAETGILLYRRFQPAMIPEKYLRIETSLYPMWRFDEAVKSRFQMYYREIETLGRSFTTQIFHLSQASIYVSGRILVNNFKHSLDNGFKIIMLLRDPHDELAERFLILNKISTMKLSSLGEREVMNLRGAIDYIASLPFDDEKSLMRELKRIPIDVATALSNPVVRQLSTTDLNDLPRKSGVAAALDILGQAAIVGLRDDPDYFSRAVGEAFAIEPSALTVTPSLPRVAALADVLRTSRCCDFMIEQDREFYHTVVDAYQRTVI